MISIFKNDYFLSYSPIFILVGFCCFPFSLWDALRGLVPFVQFKKPEKQPWRSDTFSTKSINPLWVFFM